MFCGAYSLHVLIKQLKSPDLAACWPRRDTVGKRSVKSLVESRETLSVGTLTRFAGIPVDDPLARRYRLRPVEAQSLRLGSIAAEPE